jgi:hypothetical protein
VEWDWGVPSLQTTTQEREVSIMAEKKKKKAFGGYAINFNGRKETVESVMGSMPIGPSEMTKKLWAFVKEKGLGNKA